jgi:tetratricopeptide (TPR) repeat protein
MNNDKGLVLKAIQKHLTAGKIVPAIEEALKGLKDSPNDSNLLLLLGDLYLKINKGTAAIKYLQKAAEQYCNDGFLLKGIAVYKRVHRIDPGLIEIRLRLADLYARQGLISEARFEILAAIEQYEKTGQVREMIDLYHRLLEIDPSSIEVRSELAALYDRQGMTSEATSLYLAISQQCLQRNEAAQALPFLEKARKLNPQNAAVQWKMLWVYLELEETEKARSILEDFINTSISDLEILGLIIKNHTTATSMDKMHELINRVLDSSSHREPYYVLKGELFLHCGELENALNEFMLAIFEQGERFDLGRSAALMKRIIRMDHSFYPAWQKLIDLYESQHRDSDILSAYDALVEAYIHHGMFDEAEEWLLLLKDQHPENPVYFQKLNSLYARGVLKRPAVSEKIIEHQKVEDFDLEIDVDNLLDTDSTSVGKKNEPEMKKSAETSEITDLRLCG